MMQRVTTPQQLRSTWHSNQPRIPRRAAGLSSGRKYSVSRALGNNQNSVESDEKRTTIAELISKESDVIFLLKLVCISFAGGAAIKYGSVLAELPNSPNGPAALAIVCTPPAIYSVWMLLQKRD